MSDVLRELAAVVAAVGVVLLLVPLPATRSELRRAVGLIAVVAAWAVLLWSLVPEDATHKLSSATGAGAAAGVILVAALALALGTRLVLARPTVWFVLLAIALPIRVPVTVGSEEANLLVPLYAVLVLGIVAFLWGRLRGRLRAAPEGPRVLNVPLAAFLGLLLLSLLWSADQDQAAIKAACFYLPFTLLYLAVLAWWRRARALAALAVTTIAGGVIAAVVGLWQYATEEIWWNHTLQTSNVYSRFFRVNGIFYDPNILGRYLAMGILICLALAWVRRRPVELTALATAVVVMVAALAVTYSRSSTLMLMVGVALLAGRAIGPKRAVAAVAALTIVFGGAAIALSGNVRAALTDSNRLERVSEGRFNLMEGGLKIWRDDPIAGAGLGAFETRFEQKLTESQQRRVRVVISHNSPITVLSEQGLIGFALFLALLAGAGWGVVRGSRDQGEAGWGRWAIGAILVGIAVHSLLYAALFEDPTLWVLAAAGVALTPPPRPTPRPLEPAPAAEPAVP